MALIKRLAAPPPAAGNHPTALSLGTTPDGRAVTITDSDRTKHIYLIGGTGSGKSVTLTNLAIQDIANGEGFTIIDPHGDLAQGVLAHARFGDLRRVTYFDPTQDDAPAFNLLAANFDPNKLTADLVATFKMFFGDSWGFQMEALLSNALLTLLLDREHEPHTFADLRTLLISDEYRAPIVARMPEEMRSFWQHEYKQMQKDAARPILTRLSLALMPGSALRRVLTNPVNALDVRAIMDEKKILLVNLSKGALGDQPARLLGGLIVTAITQAALARQAVPEAKRTPHTLYCDEFQNFADLPSTESILSEARKYQLRLVLAHQTMAQVDARLMQNILGNVRTVVGFNVSPNDATVLARRMGRTRHVYPDTGDTYDLALQRRRGAQLFQEKMHTYVDGSASVPVYDYDGDPRQHWVDKGFHPPLIRYGRKGFPNTYRPDQALAWLHSVADTDPNTYDPGQPTEFKWQTKTWPAAQDFQNLPTCHAFVMRNVASSTCELRVPFPPPAPNPNNLATLRNVRQGIHETEESGRAAGRRADEMEREAERRAAPARAEENRRRLANLLPEQRARLSPELLADMEAMNDPAWWVRHHPKEVPTENQQRQKPQEPRSPIETTQDLDDKSMFSPDEDTSLPEADLDAILLDVRGCIKTLNGMCASPPATPTALAGIFTDEQRTEIGENIDNCTEAVLQLIAYRISDGEPVTDLQPHLDELTKLYEQLVGPRDPATSKLPPPDDDPDDESDDFLT